VNATASAVLRAAQAVIDEGYVEQGTNLTRFGAWYGMQGGEWCAMFVSWCLAHGGFSDDDGETTNVPQISQTSSKGWAYVPYMTENFVSAGRRFFEPEVGDIFCINSQGHTGLVAAVNGDGTFTSAEGNYLNRAANVRRTIGSCYYLRPPYSASAASTGPDLRWWFLMGVMRKAA
jgi:CHAP domain